MFWEEPISNFYSAEVEFASPVHTLLAPGKKVKGWEEAGPPLTPGSSRSWSL